MPLVGQAATLQILVRQRPLPLTIYDLLLIIDYFSVFSVLSVAEFLENQIMPECK